MDRWQFFQQEASNAKTSSTLTAQAAVYVLAEYIKHPHASFEELSALVAKRKVIAPPRGIIQLFKEHNLKKNPI